MMGLSLIHWVIVLAIVVLLFGAGRLPNVMGDFAKGIKAFRAGLKEEDPPPEAPRAPIQAQAQPAPTATVHRDEKVG